MIVPITQGSPDADCAICILNTTIFCIWSMLLSRASISTGLSLFHESYPFSHFLIHLFRELKTLYLPLSPIRGRVLSASQIPSTDILPRSESCSVIAFHFASVGFALKTASYPSISFSTIFDTTPIADNTCRHGLHTGRWRNELFAHYVFSRYNTRNLSPCISKDH